MAKQEIILAVETSCDETAAAILADGKKLLANVVASQIKIHQKYGGVVPEIASRHHLEQVNMVIEMALAEAKLGFSDLSGIAVAYGPGLAGALLVGVNTAKALAYSLGLPLIGVNHIEGHIYANWLVSRDIEFPLVCLVVSGGHTLLVKMEGHGEYLLLGQTQDDAAGEAFDKVARVMGLGYPGGPMIDKLAKRGNPKAIELPRAWLGADSYNFSFSGLKTAVLNYLNKVAMKKEEVDKADLAASFQESVIEVLVEKTMCAAKKHGVKTILLAGGVSANTGLRERFKTRCEEEKKTLYIPPIEYCTDNAAMIAAAGYYRYMARDWADWRLNAVPGLKLCVKEGN